MKQWLTLINVNVNKTNGDKVEGSWVQNHFGTTESARAKADAIEIVNSNKITIAVVRHLSFGILDGPCAPVTRLA
jgi:hypothetical protein